LAQGSKALFGFPNSRGRFRNIAIFMMHLRGLVIFSFFLPGAPRRSNRFMFLPGAPRRSTRFRGSEVVAETKLLPVERLARLPFKRGAPVFQRRGGRRAHRRAAIPAFAAFHPAALGGRARPAVMGEEPPPNLDTVCAEARTALQEAVLNGKRGLTVDASMASLDVTSRDFDAGIFSRFVLEISKALTVLDGSVLLFMPSLSAVAKTRELLDSVDLEVWPQDARERLRITTFGIHGAPPADAAGLPAAVVVAGLTSSYDTDDNSYRIARKWLQAAPVAVCINARVEMLPIEMAAFEAAYCIITYTVAKTDTRRSTDANRSFEESGKAMLWRSYPGKWRVMVSWGTAGEWELAQETVQRPGDDEINAIVLPQFGKRQAAIESTQRALGGGAAGPVPSSSPSSSSFSGAGAGRLEGSSEGGAGSGAENRVGADGVVTLRGEEVNGGYGPRALYTALILHRLRTLAEAACLDPTADEVGMHILLPERAEDAAAVWDPKFGRMRGGYLVVCHLVPDGAGARAASLVQLAVGDAATADDIKSVLRRAVDEAVAAGQETIVVESLSSLTGRSSEALRLCLGELGFDGGPERLCLRLVDAETARGGDDATKEVERAPEGKTPSAPAPFSELTGGDGDDGDDGDEDIQLRLGPVDADTDGGDAVADGDADAGQGDDAEGITFGSQEDIDRLKRMFGEPL